MKNAIIPPLLILLVAGNVTAGLLAYNWYRNSQDLDQLAEKLQAQLEQAHQKLAITQAAPKPIVITNSTVAAVIPEAPDDQALRDSLAEREAQLQALRKQLAEKKETPPIDKSFAERMQERMEKFQKENPDEYSKMQERRERMRNQMSDRIFEQTEFFSSSNLEGLPPEYVENNRQLVAELTGLQTMMDEMMQNPSSWFERHGEMRERYSKINDLMKVEREVMMTELAGELEMDTKGAADFTEYVDYLYQITTPPRPSGRGPGGRGGTRGSR